MPHRYVKEWLLLFGILAAAWMVSVALLSAIGQKRR